VLGVEHPVIESVELESDGRDGEVLGELLALGRCLHADVVRRQTQDRVAAGVRARAGTALLSSTPANATARNYPARTCR
jgi:hypothetical protein